MVQPRVKSSKINAVNQKKFFFTRVNIEFQLGKSQKILQLVTHSFWFPLQLPPISPDQVGI